MAVKNYTLSPKAVSEELAHKVDSFDPMAENRAMGATNTMALYTMALLGCVSFLSSSPIVTLPTPSLASQEDNSDFDDDDSDDIIPNLADISSASSKDTFRPSVGSFFAKGQPREPALHQLQRHDFFITYIKEFTPRCSLFPGVNSVIIHSPTLPSSPAVSSFPNSPNNLFTLSDLKHCNHGYIQADSIIYANDSTWRW
ncbi:hypothetical protein D6D28_10141 [Aureobasidium pullulans]|uniref:Uncharacterized protein n=1 Tax=Aureobasidium pullulans TaxID=5580 RepID=A0A4S8S2U3_AURPU|nr:hypothetical protein D6D28_10141 [Aureobasidium pullulans]